MGWQDMEGRRRSAEQFARKRPIEEALDSMTLADFKPSDVVPLVKFFDYFAAESIGGGPDNMDHLEKRIVEINAAKAGQVQERVLENGGTIVELTGAAAQSSTEG